MSYSDLLWDNSQIVIRQSYFQRALVQDFMVSIRQRIQIQQNYSFQLKNLSINIDKTLSKQYPDRNYLIFALSAFKSDVVRRENLTKTFINHLRDQVLNKTKQFYDGQIGQAKRLQKQIAIIEAGLVEIRKKMQSAKLKLSQLDKSRQQEFMKLEIAKVRISVSKQQRQKQIAKAAAVQKQYKDYDVTYRVIMKQYNTYIEEYLDSIEYYLKIFQTQEQERVGKMIDNIKKIMVFESAMMRNFEYDIINIINQMNDLEQGKDIKEFAQKYTKGNKKPKQQNVPKLNLRSTVIYDMLIRKLEDRLELEAVEIKRLTGDNNLTQKQIYHNGISKDKNQVQSKGFQFQNIKLFVDSKQQLEINELINGKFKQIFDKDDNRNFAQLYIKYKCQASNYESDQSIETIIKFLIQKCIAKKDVFCIRRILNLIFTQASIKTFKNKQTLLYFSITSMHIWQSHDFWQASIFESVQQKLKFSRPQKGQSKQDAKARQKIAILNQLADHCNMMVMLGYNIKSIKLLAGKFLKLYELGEEQSKHLLNILWQSTNVYNEIGMNKSEISGQTSGSEKNQIQYENK